MVSVPLALEAFDQALEAAPAAEAVVRAEGAFVVQAWAATDQALAAAARAWEVVALVWEVVALAWEAAVQTLGAVGQVLEAVVQASASDLASIREVPGTRTAVDPSGALRVSADRPFAAAVELDASGGQAASHQAPFEASGVRPPRAATSGRPRSVSVRRQGAHREAPARRSRAPGV